mgnify:CR=1 FL=1
MTNEFNDAFTRAQALQRRFNPAYMNSFSIAIKYDSYYEEAKLLTTHPSSSYELVRDANKQYTLRITNPQIFWSTSKYLVVLVK